MCEDKKLINNFPDKRFKGKNINETESYLQSIGCKIELDIQLNSELTGIVESQNHADKIFLCKDLKLAIVESEYTDPNNYSINKLLKYGCILRTHYDEIKEKFADKGNFPQFPEIRKIMINENPRKFVNNFCVPLNNDEGCKNIEMYTPYVINGDEMLDKIKYKIKHNKPLNKNEYEFFNYPLNTNFKKEPHKFLIEVTKLMLRLNFDKKQKELLSICYEDDCKRFINKKYIKQTLEEIKMISDKVAEHDRKIEEKGIRKGIKNVIESLERNGFSDEIITFITNEFNI